MNSLDLTGRTAIVTGASRGIGLATAQAIATAGGNVVLTSRSQSPRMPPPRRSAPTRSESGRTPSTRRRPRGAWN
jgi:NAD(P)-dependent dehydrogenase (short-subunit alcohol dehydrogenase family)